VIDNLTYSGLSYNNDGYSDWVDNATPTIAAHATDQDPANANAGLGIKKFQFSIPYASGNGDQTVNLWCTGANAAPCPQSASSGPVSYDTSQMPSGGTVIGVTATDAMSNADVRIPVVRVDHSAPEIGTVGDFGGPPNNTDDTDPNPVDDGSTETLPANTIEVDATDGDASDPSGASWQSGVRSVILEINGQQVAATGQHDCTRLQGSCPLSVQYTVDPNQYPTGTTLHFRVTATDELGHARVEQWDETDTGDSSTVTSSDTAAASGAGEAGSYFIHCYHSIYLTKTASTHMYAAHIMSCDGAVQVSTVYIAIQRVYHKHGNALWTPVVQSANACITPGGVSVCGVNVDHACADGHRYRGHGHWVWSPAAGAMGNTSGGRHTGRVRC
jgi:hypothetical protein